MALCKAAVARHLRTIADRIDANEYVGDIDFDTKHIGIEMSTMSQTFTAERFVEVALRITLPSQKES